MSKSPVEQFRSRLNNLRYTYEKSFIDTVSMARNATELGWALESSSPLSYPEDDVQDSQKLFIEPSTVRRVRNMISEVSTKLQRGLMSPEDPRLAMLTERPFSPAMHDAFVGRLQQIQITTARMREEFAQAEIIPVAENVTTALHSIEVPGSSKNALVCPGSFTGPKNFVHFATGLATTGFNTYVPEVNTPEQEFHEGSSERLTVIEEAYTQSVIASIDYALKSKPDQGIDLVGFSTGAAAVVNAALRHPHKIRRVVLMNPVGVASVDDSIITRAKEILGGSLQHGSALAKNGYLDAAQYPQYADFANWIPRQTQRKLKFGELAQIAHTAITANLLPKIAKLKEMGVEVMILATEDDALMPLNKIEQSLRSRGLSEILLTLKGLHTKSGHDPEATAHWVASFLDPDTENAYHSY